ncbi:hypothetical protein Vafri_8901 [Volvox africanus]|uniref:Uncharacterized protein n=1 Tax=Volvox africanus TaxID=51714 RepID=A0A8J4B3Z7_9CHLO|nr:hypothetical protein Vafri_8901 [Volvox africanus]
MWRWLTLESRLADLLLGGRAGQTHCLTPALQQPPAPPVALQAPDLKDGRVEHQGDERKRLPYRHGAAIRIEGRGLIGWRMHRMGATKAQTPSILDLLSPPSLIRYQTTSM